MQLTLKDNPDRCKNKQKKKAANGQTNSIIPKYILKLNPR